MRTCLLSTSFSARKGLSSGVHPTTAKTNRNPTCNDHRTRNVSLRTRASSQFTRWIIYTSDELVHVISDYVTLPKTHRHAVWMTATVLLILSWLLVLFMQVLSGMEREQTTSRPVAEDYGPYDWISKGKFSTSQIQLVLLEHQAVSRIQPNHGGSMAYSLALSACWTVACTYDGCLDSEDLFGSAPRL